MDSNQEKTRPCNAFYEALAVDTMRSYTERAQFACPFGEGKVYLTICEEAGQPVFVDVVIGKTGNCARALLGALCAVINLHLENGHDLDELSLLLSGTRCDKGICGPGKLSCVDALGHMMRAYVPGSGAPSLDERTKEAFEKVRKKREKRKEAPTGAGSATPASGVVSEDIAASECQCDESDRTQDHGQDDVSCTDA